MKLLIAGSRSLEPPHEVMDDLMSEAFAFAKHWGKVAHIDEIVSGTAKGIDRTGEKYAEHFKIPVKRFPADWDKYGKKAGHLRNAEMAKYCDEAIIIWDCKSTGTKNMMDQMDKLNKPYCLIEIDTPNGRYKSKWFNVGDRLPI